MTTLTPRSLVIVLLKVWAFTLAVQVVLSIPSLLSHLRSVGPDTAAWRSVFGWTLVHIVLTAVVSVWVLKFADTVADWLIQNTDGLDEPYRGSFEAVAFGTLGVYF